MIIFEAFPTQWLTGCNRDLGQERKYLVIKLSKLLITLLLHTAPIYIYILYSYFVPYASYFKLSKLFITLLLPFYTFAVYTLLYTVLYTHTYTCILYVPYAFLLQMFNKIINPSPQLFNTINCSSKRRPSI